MGHNVSPARHAELTALWDKAWAKHRRALRSPGQRTFPVRGNTLNTKQYVEAYFAINDRHTGILK